MNFAEFERVKETGSFKLACWEWFDTLPQDKRDFYNEKSGEAAEMFFFNQVWSKRK